MKIFPIVFTGDANYIKYISVTMASIMSNADKNVFYKFFILSDEVDEETQFLLKNWINKYSNFSLEIIIMNELSQKSFFVNSRHGKGAYYLLYIPKIFRDYERVLYLDGDIIVNYDISEMLDMDFDDNIVMGVTDYVCDFVNSDMAGYKDYFYNTLKLKEPQKYINSGVVLFNTKKIAKLGLEDEFINIIDIIKEPKHHDQCLLNCIVGKIGETGIISSKFNSLRTYYTDINISYSYILIDFILKLLNLRKKENSQFYIYHFLNSDKPWNSNRKSNRLFYKYLYSINQVKPPMKIINQIIKENKIKHPIHWKLFMKFFS